MAPEDRRAALIEATIPLILEFGVEVSTRQIAQAAGVAEGTIFGVFPDKTSLLVAALVKASDPQPTLDGLARIDPAKGLRVRLAVAAELVNARFQANVQLMNAVRKLIIGGAHPSAAAQMMEARSKLLAALTELLQSDAALLRRPPDAVAGLLLLFCGANVYGPFGDPENFDGEELVSLLLDGLLERSSTGNHHGGV